MHFPTPSFSHSSEEWLIHAAKQSSRFRRFSDLRSLILPHVATDVHHVSLNVRKSRSCKRSTQAYTHHDGESGCIFTHQTPRGCSVQLDQCQSLPSPLRLEESFCSSERSCVLSCSSLVLVLQYVSRIFSDACPLFELVVPD